MSKRKFNPQYFCICDKSYSQKRQIRKHISLCEYAQNPAKDCFLDYKISKCELVYGNENKNPIKVHESFQCGCKKNFVSRGGYYRHIKTCHLRPEPQAVTGKTKCNEPGCQMTFKYIKDFRQHLNKKHQIQFDVENKEFNTYSDFLNWKVNYESETRSCFYHRKNLTRNGRRVEYWYCNRSGSYQSSTQSRKRRLKSQGLLKINNNCTSSIILSVNEIDDTVQAVLHHTHYGHEAELVHLRIPKTDKQEIASKLLQGVNIKDILSSYKEDELSKQTERKHLIKRRDILNISKKHNVNIISPKAQPSKKKSKDELVHKTVETPIINSLSSTTEAIKRHIAATQLLALSMMSPIRENVCISDKTYSQKRQIRKNISLCEYAQNPAKDCFLDYKISNCELVYQNDNKNPIKVHEPFQCGCKKNFVSRGGYYRHIKTCHLRPEPQAVTGKTKCNEPGCQMTFKYIKDFRQHLNKKHQIQFDVENKKFNTYSDFLNWKVNYESETRSSFYHRKNLTRNGRRVEYWYCNRSGRYQSSTQSRRRRLKSQGLLKINNNCTSSIILSVNEIDDTVQAVLHHTHYGHEAELVHLRIPKTDKQEIASKLLEGVNIKDILSSYKEDELSKQTERKHLIKRRDILNISKKHNVNIISPKAQPSKKKSKDELVHKTVETPIINSFSSTTEANKRHITASQQLALSLVSPIRENVWRICMGNRLVSTFSSNNCNQGVYNVTKNDVISCSSDNCKSYCNSCYICYHAYSCTCSDFISKTVICEHIHLTVIYRANQETCQNENNIKERLFGNQDHTMYTKNYREPSNSIPIKNVKSSHHKKNNNTCKPINMKAENLKTTKTRLNKLMTDTLKKIDECNNSDLFENQDHTMYTKNDREPSNSIPIKNFTSSHHKKNNNICKPINMKAENLKTTKTRLNKLMTDTLKKIDECNNSDLFGNQDHTMYTKNDREPSNSIPIKNFTSSHHKKNNICKPINMEVENLISTKTRLNKLMTDTLKKMYKCNDSDLLQNLEKEITNLSCNLGRDLLKNTTKKKKLSTN